MAQKSIDPTATYARWRAFPGLSADLAQELEAITGDTAAIQSRFWRNLAFGTGGLRGVLGAGTNRMNVLTVARATKGLADYLLAGNNPSVCIAYDTRNMSREFAHTAAGVLCAQGLRVWLYENVRPTPMLSFAVRHKQAGAGIVITASHNPREYNGYKVYGPDGGQITDEVASTILAAIERHDALEIEPQGMMSLAEAEAAGLLSWMGEDVDAPYYEKVKALVLRNDLVREQAPNFKILYTPLHGAGNVPVRRVLRELGFAQVTVVPEQESPNGDFPTTPRPNPEEPEVYDLALDMSTDLQPDLIFATDPDCDRIGVLAQAPDGNYTVLTGNQVGALLCEYILSARQALGCLPANSAVVKTIVTSQLADAICRAHGVAVYDTLTGFKYIGALAGAWAESGEHSFLLGFEESCGYLSGDFVRDKDAVIASVLVAEMALWHASQGRGLLDAVEDIYRRYGYSSEALESVEMEGREGQERIASLMSNLRAKGTAALPGESILVIEDYQSTRRLDCATGEETTLSLPQSNVLKYKLADGSWLAFRPSGTEPKIKLYIGASGNNRQAADDRLLQLSQKASKLINE